MASFPLYPSSCCYERFEHLLTLLPFITQPGHVDHPFPPVRLDFQHYPTIDLCSSPSCYTTIHTDTHPEQDGLPLQTASRVEFDVGVGVRHPFQTDAQRIGVHDERGELGDEAERPVRRSVHGDAGDGRGFRLSRCRVSSSRRRGVYEKIQAWKLTSTPT